MKTLLRFATCLAISLATFAGLADPVPADAFGVYSGSGKGTTIIVEPYKFKMTYFLEIKDATTAEMVFVQDGKPPSDPLVGSCYFVQPNHLLLKFETSPTSIFSGTFALKGKAGKSSLKGTMNTVIDGYIGATQIASKFKQNPG